MFEVSTPIGATVEVVAKSETLPKKAKMYAGQTGQILEVYEAYSGVYYLVQFQNGDMAAYLARELQVVTSE